VPRSGRSPIWRRRPLGAITYGIYPTSAPGEVRHLLQHGGAALIVVEDQEHLDNTLEVLDTCTKVRGVLVVDTRALFMDRHPRVRLARSLSPDDRRRSSPMRAHPGASWPHERLAQNGAAIAARVDDRPPDRQGREVLGDLQAERVQRFDVRIFTAGQQAPRLVFVSAVRDFRN